MNKCANAMVYMMTIMHFSLLITLATVIFNPWFLVIQVNIWYLHRHLICYIWYLIHGTWYPTPVFVMLYLSLNIWHRYLPCYTYHLISDTGTYHAILDGWRAITHLTCDHLVLVYLIWYCDTWLDTIISGTCITLHIHDYYFTGTWHDYYTVTRPLVLLNSYAPVLLYSWTPVTGRLLILILLMTYSRWSL